MLKRKSLSQLPAVRVLGRSPVKEDAVTLFWTGAGLAFAFDGQEVSVEFYADYAVYEPWVSVEVDGAWVARFPVAKGESVVSLFRGMSAGTVHQIRLLKEVQAMSDDPAHLLQVRALRFDGTFVPLPPVTRRIEFLGDSLTSGEGTIGAQRGMDWISLYFTAQNNYARLTADALGAEFRIVSQSGWGVVSGWDNDPRHVLPPYYSRVCGPAQGARNAALGAQAPNDFAAWPADAVVIHLLANDACAFHSPAWHEPGTGRVFAQRMRDAATYEPDDLARLSRAIRKTLAEVRRRNPQAVIVWAYGMLPLPLAPTLTQAAAAYCAESGDANIFTLALPAVEEETIGSRGHPGARCHEAAAQTLAQFLRPLLEK